MKKLTLLTLSLALLLPIAATAATENNCERGGKFAGHRDRAQMQQQQQDPLTLQEIEVLAQAQALRRVGTGATAEVTPVNEGGYLITIKSATGETVQSYQVTESGRPESRHQHRKGAMPAS
ncbi:MAG: hypothetical protein IBX50_09525 [Marinospirillum sp.]|nr:hypothetical protein [Marinospirillum sp.]